MRTIIRAIAELILAAAAGAIVVEMAVLRMNWRWRGGTPQSSTQLAGCLVLGGCLGIFVWLVIRIDAFDAARQPEPYAWTYRRRTESIGVPDSGPVPANPPHCCPNCDYCLRGNTSRVCPECGQSFTLIEALRRGREIEQKKRHGSIAAIVAVCAVVLAGKLGLDYAQYTGRISTGRAALICIGLFSIFWAIDRVRKWLSRSGR